MKKKYLRIIKYLALVATIILALLKIYEFISSPSLNLTAEGINVPFEPSPKFVQMEEEIIKLQSTDKLKSIIDCNNLYNEHNNNSILINEITSKLLQFLSSEFNTNIINIGKIQSFWQFLITNNGEQELNSVVLVIPNVCEVEIIKEGVSQIIMSEDRPIKIGTLQPQEVVLVKAWSQYRIPLYRSSDIKLTHNKGIGKITLLKQVGKMGQFFDTFWGIILILLIVIISISLLIYFDLRGAKKDVT